MTRRSTLRWVRAGKARDRESGFLITWDVDSADRAGARRLQRFVYGHSVETDGKRYRYPGFVERDGVRYLGQSVLFVRPSALGVIVDFLSKMGVDHEVSRASVG